MTIIYNVGERVKAGSRIKCGSHSGERRWLAGRRILLRHDSANFGPGHFGNWQKNGLVDWSDDFV